MTKLKHITSSIYLAAFNVIPSINYRGLVKYLVYILWRSKQHMLTAPLIYEKLAFRRMPVSTLHSTEFGPSHNKVIVYDWEEPCAALMISPTKLVATGLGSLLKLWSRGMTRP